MIIKTLVDQLLTFWLLNLKDHLVDLHLLIFLVHSEIRCNVRQDDFSKINVLSSICTVFHLADTTICFQRIWKDIFIHKQKLFSFISAKVFTELRVYLELATIVYETWDLRNLLLVLLNFEKSEIWIFPPAQVA